MKEKRVNVGESRTLAKEREIKAGAWRGKCGLHNEGMQIPRRKGRASKARRAFLVEVEGSTSG